MGKECENEKQERIVYFLCSGLLPPWACCGFYFHTGLMISREREREKKKGLSHVLIYMWGVPGKWYCYIMLSPWERFLIFLNKNFITLIFCLIDLFSLVCVVVHFIFVSGLNLIFIVSDSLSCIKCTLHRKSNTFTSGFNFFLLQTHYHALNVHYTWKVINLHPGLIWTTT